MLMNTMMKSDMMMRYKNMNMKIFQKVKKT